MYYKSVTPTQETKQETRTDIEIFVTYIVLAQFVGVAFGIHIVLNSWEWGFWGVIPGIIFGYAIGTSIGVFGYDSGRKAFEILTSFLICLILINYGIPKLAEYKELVWKDFWFIVGWLLVPFAGRKFVGLVHYITFAICSRWPSELIVVIIVSGIALGFSLRIDYMEMNDINIIRYAGVIVLWCILMRVIAHVHRLDLLKMKEVFIGFLIGGATGIIMVHGDIQIWVQSNWAIILMFWIYEFKSRLIYLIFSTAYVSMIFGISWGAIVSNFSYVDAVVVSILTVLSYFMARCVRYILCRVCFQG